MDLLMLYRVLVTITLTVLILIRHILLRYILLPVTYNSVLYAMLLIRGAIQKLPLHLGEVTILIQQTFESLTIKLLKGRYQIMHIYLFGGI